MTSITVTRKILAPTSVVFNTVADPSQFAQAISGDTKVEFLSENKLGVGTRFRQSRVVNDKETTMEFEVTESVQNEQVRIINETRGTLWDSIFIIIPSGQFSTLIIQMEAISKKWFPKLLLPIMMPLFIKKAVEKDMDDLKSFCEQKLS